MKFTIPRDKWLRGEGGLVSRLLRPRDGKMCCLGHFGLACGLSSEMIEDRSNPIEIITDINPPDAWTQKNNNSAFLFASFRDSLNFPLSTDCSTLMEVNDDKSISDEDRERAIVNIFSAHEIEVEFTS